MQKIGDMFGGKSAEAAVIHMRKYGPKGHPIAQHHWQDALSKILFEFQIKHPADKRFWHLAKTNFGLIEQKVAYIREVMEADRKKISPWQTPKLAPEYAGLLISLIFPKKKS